MRNWFLLFLLVSFCAAYGGTPKAPVFSHHGEEIRLAVETAKQAGALLLEYWDQEIDLKMETKEGRIAAIADLKSNDLICKKLISSFPEYGLIAEKRVEDEAVQKAVSRVHETELTWVVDPLNGARSFIDGGKEFGVHIALLEHGIPVLGVNYYPVAKRLYLGVAGCGAYKQMRRGALRPIHADGKAGVLRPAISSRRSEFVHAFYSALLGVPLTKKMLRKDFRCMGSTGLRLCQIAEGKRNIDAIYDEPCHVWDVASGYVILQEAGGVMADLTGERLCFSNPDHRLQAGALSCGSGELFERAIQVFKEVQKAKSMLAPP